MSDRGLFDPGLQPERTELAWRRTALAIGVGSLVAARILPELLGSVLWALAGLAGVAFAVVMWALARRRYLAWTGSLLSATSLPGAGLLLALAIFTMLCGALLAVVAVLVAFA